MKVTKYYCDNCGKEITDAHCEVKITVENMKGNGTTWKNRGAQICQDCFDSIPEINKEKDCFEFIKNLIEKVGVTKK